MIKRSHIESDVIVWLITYVDILYYGERIAMGLTEQREIGLWNYSIRRPRVRLSVIHDAVDVL